MIFKPLQNMSSSKKAVFVFVLASVISSGINIITTPIFTRLMPVSDYGVVSLYNSWHQMLNVIATFSVTNAVVNVGFHDYQNDRYGFLSSALGISSLFSFITGIILLAFSPIILETNHLSISLIILMILSFLFLTATQLWLCLQRYEYRYKFAFWLISGSAIVSTIISICFVIKADRNYANIKLWSSNLIPIIVGVVLYCYIIFKGKKFINKEYWRFIIAFNSPLIIHYFSQFLLSGSDRIMIGYFASESSVAIYSLAYSVANILLIVWNPINSSLVPYIHKCVDSANDDELRKLFISVLSVSGALCVIVSLCAPEIISILGGEKYAVGAYIVPPVICSTFCIVLYSITANIEFLFGKTKRIALMTIIAAGLNVILNIIFIPRFGYIAAAYTTMVSYIAYAFLHYNNLKKLMSKSIINGLKLSIAIVVFIFFNLCTMLLYDSFLSRILLGALLLVGVFFIAKKGNFQRFIRGNR